jgi:signal transduction histidine kinase
MSFLCWGGFGVSRRYVLLMRSRRHVLSVAHFAMFALEHLGYRIGNYGILDTKPHPQGLTESEKKTLGDFALLTMKILVDRREKLHIREQREKLIANTAHDLMTPLTGLQLSLSVLKMGTETDNLLSDHETQLIETAENCSAVMARICTSSFAELREDAGPGALIGRPLAANPETEGKLDELVNCLYKVSTVLAAID